jgi:hypothetical protein
MSWLCKDCNRAKVYAWRDNNPEKYAQIRSRYSKSEIGLLAKRRWSKTGKGRALDRKHKTSAEYIAWRKKYEKSVDVRAYRSAYKARPDRMERTRQLAKCPRKREYQRILALKKFRTSIGRRINNAMSCRIRAFIRKGRASWIDLVGYSQSELMSHLERQFTDGMTWQNFGRKGWHIDHILPISSFKFSSAEDDEFKACWGLGNLRPCWAIDNLRKHAKRAYLI